MVRCGLGASIKTLALASAQPGRQHHLPAGRQVDFFDQVLGLSFHHAMREITAPQRTPQTFTPPLGSSRCGQPQKSFRPRRRESPKRSLSSQAYDGSVVIRSTFTTPTRPKPTNPYDGTATDFTITKKFATATG